MTRIRFEDLPSTNTPRSAENLNKLNNVVISPTEPTTGEEVWIQKSKNLFNINNLTVEDGVVDKELGTITVNRYDNTVYETLEQLAPDLVAGKTYTLNAKTTSSNAPYIYLHGSETTWSFGTSRTLTSEEINNRMNIYGVYDTTDTVVISEFQIELGDTATSYEPYVDKKIHTKNDNGVYEEFYDEESLNWKKAINNNNGTMTIPINWNNLKEISIKVLGNDGVSCAYITIPKEQWYDNGETPIKAPCFNDTGTLKGCGIFTVSQKNENNFIITLGGNIYDTIIYYK